MKKSVALLRKFLDETSKEELVDHWNSIDDFDSNEPKINEYFNTNIKTMKVKVINKSKFKLPEYKTSGSAGMDVYANINESISILPGKRCLIPTGLFYELPETHEFQLRPRSGLALKNGITICNTPGTLDSDYRGEIGAILINHGEEIFIVNPGDRIAQLILTKVEKCEWIENNELSETERAEGGFGHSGIN